MLPFCRRGVAGSVALFAVFALLAIAPVPAVKAQTSPIVSGEFRVNSRLGVKEGRKSRELQTNRTLFRTTYAGEEAYDFFVGKNGDIETTLLDLGRERIVLLNPKRKVKCELKLLEIAKFISEQKDRAKPSDIGFFAPQFTISKQDNRLSLTSKALTYHVDMQRTSIVDGHSRYEAFASWYARMNGMIAKNAPPPGRLEVNRLVAEEGMVPRRVEKTMIRGGVRTELWTEHEFIGKWNRGDRELVEAAQQQLASFKEVGIQEYYGVASTANASTATQH